jgi:hypothetical protein
MPIQIEAPPELASVRKRFEAIDSSQFDRIAQSAGLPDANPPVRVLVVTERSDVAGRVPQWVAGFAVDESVVIFPARSPSYPDDTLEDVLRHEIAHVMVFRASAGHPIPRWFNEGFAMTAERTRGLRDETQFIYQIARGYRTTLPELDRLFEGRQSDQTRAYAISGALVHDVLDRHGRTAASAILTRVARGDSFETAFTTVTGSTPANANSDFWQSQRIWTTWLPVVTSTTALWMAVTVLALLAIYRRWRRNLEIEKRWEQEEELEREDEP